MATGKAALLLWAQRCTEGYEGVHVTDFSQSWADGLAFCAIVAHCSPQSLDFEKARALLREKGALEVHRLAFTTAEALGCPALLDAEDMVALSRPEPFSVMTYLSQMHRTFAKKMPAPAPRPQEQQQQQQQHSAFVTEHKAEEQPRLCAKCGKAVDGEAVGACGRMFHPACFCCFGCGKRLHREYLTVAGGAYCDRCGRKAFLANTAREFRQKKGIAEPEPRPPKDAAPAVPAAVPHMPVPSKPVPPRPPKPAAPAPAATAAEPQDPFADPFAVDVDAAGASAAPAPGPLNTSDSDPFAVTTEPETPSPPPPRPPKPQAAPAAAEEVSPPPRPPKPADVAAPAPAPATTTAHTPTTEDLLFGTAPETGQQQAPPPPQQQQQETFGVDLTATLLGPQCETAATTSSEDDSDLFGLPPQGEVQKKMEEMLQAAKARRSQRKTQRLPLPVAAENPDVFEYNAVTRYSIKPGEAPVLLDVPPSDPSAAPGSADDDNNPFALPPGDTGDTEDNPFAVAAEPEAAAAAPSAFDDDPFADPFAVDADTAATTTTTTAPGESDSDFDPFGALAIKETQETQTAGHCTEGTRTGAVRLLQAHAKPIVEGVLEKQNDSALLTRFVPRYCLLEGRQLVYYPEGSKDASMAPSGTVDLFFADGVEPFAPRALSFAIRSGDRLVVFGARSARDYGLWTSAIATVVASLKITHVQAPPQVLRHQVQLDEEKCGWLECFCARAVLLPKQWRRVWVVLRGGVVTYAADRHARVAGKLALYKAVLSEYQPDQMRNAFELATFVNDKHHSLVLRADTTEAMHEWLNAVLRQKLAIEDTIDNLTL